MKYIVSYEQANRHYIDIEFIVNNVSTEKLNFQLPAWRPGRYELGNFAKNTKKWKAFDSDGRTLPSKKITKDLWEVETKGSRTIHVKYNYFANEINAGSSYLDDKQLYVNGVNCFLYVPNRTTEACTLELKIPSNYQVATGLKEISKHQFSCSNFDALVDSPFIASADLKHHSYVESGVKFHLWFQGECKPDWQLLEKDFRKFSKAQIEKFGDFPVEEYHFLFQILTHRTYHGVEHSNSTVIALGPSYDLFKKDGWYNELLGVSSHELYHTWNVKQIRPIEMLPYDYSKENYTQLGYLDEGVTTYYGDKFLFTSDVFDWKQYAKTFNQLLERHFSNFGSQNYSVAQSSFDTWLDGYVKGVPNRKSSIYTEGALVAFLTDIFILKATANKKSLNDVMRILYTDFAKNGKGISNEDYRLVVEKVSGKLFQEIYEQFLHGTADYTNALKLSLNYIGCYLKVDPSPVFNEAFLGFKVKYTHKKCLVDAVFPNAIADKNGFSEGDEIIAINSIKINDDLNQWTTYFQEEEMVFSIKRALGTIENIPLKKSADIFFKKYTIQQEDAAHPNFIAWKN